MENFNSKRFLRIMRWYLGENRQHLQMWIIGVVVGVFFLESMFVFMFNRSLTHFPVYEDTIRSVYGLILMSAVVCIIVCISNIFLHLKTKGQRIAFFMLPATNLERYLAAWCYAVVVLPLCILTAAFLGDLLRSLLFTIMGQEWLPMLKIASNRVHFSGFSSCVSILWFGSLYVLGATYFHKNNFFIVTAGLFVLFTIISIALTSMKGEWSYALLHTSNALVDCLVNVVLLGLTVFNYLTSYSLFKRFQIITSKWTNV